MATKQATGKKSNIPAATAPARETKPKAARVTTVKHSKATIIDTPAAESAIESPVIEKVVPAVVENPHEAIAKLAYGYWASRGFQGGSPAEDWLRAEAEYRRKS